MKRTVLHILRNNITHQTYAIITRHNVQIINLLNPHLKYQQYYTIYITFITKESLHNLREQLLIPIYLQTKQIQALICFTNNTLGTFSLIFSFPGYLPLTDYTPLLGFSPI